MGLNTCKLSWRKGSSHSDEWRWLVAESLTNRLERQRPITCAREHLKGPDQILDYGLQFRRVQSPSSQKIELDSVVAQVLRTQHRKLSFEIMHYTREVMTKSKKTMYCILTVAKSNANFIAYGY
jgi:hypothetical protein